MSRLRELRSGSWGFITYSKKHDMQLGEYIKENLDHIPFDSNVSNIENLMKTLGYRLEYEISMHDDVYKQVYTWNPSKPMFFPIKYSYMVLDTIFKNGGEIVGVLEDGGDGLYWYDSRGAKKHPYIGNVYLSNINNGFTEPEDLQGLKEVLDYPNDKEKTMIVLACPFFTGWFEDKKKLLES